MFEIVVSARMSPLPDTSNVVMRVAVAATGVTLEK